MQIQIYKYHLILDLDRLVSKMFFLRNPFVKGENKKKGFIFQIRGENHPTLKTLKTSLEQALTYKDVNKRYASYL